MKNNFDRRDLLKGLLALPGAAAMGGLTSSCAKNEVKNNSIVDFSVVVHGTCAVQFDTQNKQLQVLIPTVLENGTEAHQYLKGLFRDESPFEASPDHPIALSLSEDPRNFVILRKQDLQRDPNGPLRNIFQLPYPKSLQWLRAEKFKTDGHKFFDNATLISKMPTQVPVALALQYDVAVEGPFPVPNIHYHIFAERGTPESIEQLPEHITTAFSALTRLYKDVGDLKISEDVLNEVVKPDDVTLLTEVPSKPSGFEAAETQTLEGRRSPTGGAHFTCAMLILVSGPRPRLTQINLQQGVQLNALDT